MFLVCVRSVLLSEMYQLAGDVRAVEVAASSRSTSDSRSLSGSTSGCLAVRPSAASPTGGDQPRRS